MGSSEDGSFGGTRTHLLDPSALDPYALDELQRRGPKYGIVLPETAASVILSRLGDELLESYRVSSLGYNNRLYFVRTGSGGEYVIKVCGRYWKRVKTETEVVGLHLAGKLRLIPVPRILAWDSKGEEFGVEYTVMRKLEGIRLADVWKDLSFEKKRTVVGQLAELVVSYRSQTGPLAATLPQGKIGNFVIHGDGQVSAAKDSMEFDVGATLEGRGPWSSYKAYLKTEIEVKIESLRKDPRMATMRSLLPRVEALLETLDADDEIRDSLQFVFTHGDLTLQNLLVTFADDVPTITAVLDWEGSGMFPAEEEFFCSFDFLLEKPADDSSSDFDQLQEHFFNGLEEGGVDTPRTLPYYFQRKYLHDLRENLFPWHVNDCDDADKAIQQAVADVHQLLLKLRT